MEKFRILIFAILILSFIPWMGEKICSPTPRSQKKELIQYARNMGSKKIGYAEKWTPPGESEAWTMDCSNTVRYTVKNIFGKDLPRTSRDQYHLAVKTGKFHKAPLDSDGNVSTQEMVKSLRTGDILFWINTYNVNADPPISHVMIYLGKNSSNRMKMFGAGSYGTGEQTGSGGLDVYVFDPNRKMGCVKNQQGECILDSRFIGYARFLD